MAYLMAAVGGAAVPGMGIEELNEVQVAQKRGLDGARTMAFVRSELATALQTFAPCRKSRWRRPPRHSRTWEPIPCTR